MTDEGHFLGSVRLSDSLAMPSDPDLAHEIRVAIFDLVEANVFRPQNGARGPFALELTIEEGRLVLQVAAHRAESGVEGDGNGNGRLSVPLMSLRRLIKDYAIVCESYVEAVRTMSPSQIEAIDMGRRGLHNEAAELLREKLSAHVEMDLGTARRLFTLVYALLRRR